MLRGGNFRRRRCRDLAAERVGVFNAGGEFGLRVARVGQHLRTDVFGSAARSAIGVVKSLDKRLTGGVEVVQGGADLLRRLSRDQFGLLHALGDGLAGAAHFIDGAGHLCGRLLHAGLGVFNPRRKTKHRAIKARHRQRRAPLSSVHALGEPFERFAHPARVCGVEAPVGVAAFEVRSDVRAGRHAAFGFARGLLMGEDRLVEPLAERQAVAARLFGRGFRSLRVEPAPGCRPAHASSFRVRAHKRTQNQPTGPSSTERRLSLTAGKRPKAVYSQFLPQAAALHGRVSRHS